ncbi:MAG: hypothetical protein PHR36_00940 [Patescibacteria group bacterium]|nr:hypothetical protein [Patescibacteria group bacterium]
MAGALVALSVNKEVYVGSEGNGGIDMAFAMDLFWLTFYHHHLINTKFGGMATLSPAGAEEPIIVETHKGEFSEQFERDLEMFRAPLGISHLGSRVRQPYLLKRSAFPFFAICFAGVVSNREKIISAITENRYGLGMTDDVALIAQLIAKAGWDSGRSADENFKAAIASMAEEIEGACALTILTEKKIYVVRGSDGHEAISLGKKEGAMVAVSESCAFHNQGFEFVRGLEPGEMVILENGRMESMGIIQIKKKIRDQVCSFGPVYTSFPTTVLSGISAREARKRLGARLAERDIAKGFIPDIVINVPDSGRFSGIGYLNSFIQAMIAGKISRAPLFDEILVKYPDVGRSFVQSNGPRRKMVARKKLIPAVEVDPTAIKMYLREGQKKIVIVVLDDSIVRGTQTVSDLVPKIKAAFASVMAEIEIEIHLRISNPKLLSYCPWGKELKAGDDLAAVDETRRVRTSEEIAKRLGVASCFFTTTDDLAEATGIPLEHLCVDCDKCH